MIKEKIVVEYYKNKKTKEITLDYDDYTEEYYIFKQEYNVFKNNGKYQRQI